MKTTAGINKNVARREKVRIILLTISFTIIAIIGFGFWYWDTNKNVIIEKELEKAFTKSNKGFYKISYDAMKVDEETGSLLVSNMKLSYDSFTFREKKPSMLFTIQIPEISVVGVKTKKALLDKEIVGRKLEIKNPVVDLAYTYKGKDSIRNVPTEEIYREVLGNLDIIQIDSVLITNAHIRTSNKKTGKVIIDVEDVDLSLLDLRVDSLSVNDSSRFLFSRSMTINVAKIALPSPDKLYDYQAEGIVLSSGAGNLLIDRISVIPRLGEEEFVNAIPTQADRLSFFFNDVAVAAVDIQKLPDDYIKAGTMTIGRSSVKIYRDLARPRDRRNRVGLYPHQVMDDIPLRFNITRVNIQNSFIEYKERNHITRQSGKVRFYNVNGTITNFTNDKSTANKVMKAVVNSSFLNKTPLKTNWTFYLFHPNGRFDVAGTLGSLDGQALNALAEPMGPARIEEGRFNGMTFNLQGNDHSMDGSVKMLYENLDIAILEKDKGATETDKKFLTSLIANVAIKNSNPNGDDEVRVQQVHLSRDINRSLFNLCWKTIFKGIQGTVGIKKASAAN
ncbi:MAG TPA: hypothetical protein VFH08_11660 [Chitinophagaceae bacterium]|nr:hypothetical protein [Chitinophagaceae bacterium]